MLLRLMSTNNWAFSSNPFLDFVEVVFDGFDLFSFELTNISVIFSILDCVVCVIAETETANFSTLVKVILKSNQLA